MRHCVNIAMCHRNTQVPLLGVKIMTNQENIGTFSISDIVNLHIIQWQPNVFDMYIINMQSTHCLCLVIYNNKCCLSNHKPTNWHSYLLYRCVTSSTTIHTWKGPGFKMSVAMPVHRDQIEWWWVYVCLYHLPVSVLSTKRQNKMDTAVSYSGG